MEFILLSLVLILKVLLIICAKEPREEEPDILYNVGILTDGRHTVWWLKHDEIQESKCNERKRKTENLLEECYHDIVDKLKEGSPNAWNICALVLRWYLDKNKRVPSSFAMQTMVMTYYCRLNEEMNEIDRLTDSELVNRLYPNVQF